MGISVPLCGHFAPLGLLFQPEPDPAWQEVSQHCASDRADPGGATPALAIAEDP